MHFCIPFIAASTVISIASAAIFNVTVGNDRQLTYDPSSLSGVQNGDIIGFRFATGTHTVTQSTFDDPCTKKTGGLDSGTMSSTNTPQWTITIDDASAPLWFYCVPHCRRGMVFAINPTSNETFDAFSAAARGVAPSSGSTTPSATTSTSATTSVSGTSGSTTASGATSASSASSASGTATSPATTSTSATPAPNGALGQVSTHRLVLWLSTLGVVAVCLML